MATYKSVETKYLEERDAFFRGLRNLDRRTFLKVSGAALAATASLAAPHSFTPVAVAQETASEDSQPAFRFAYISDSHLLEKDINDRFVRGLLRAVDDVNNLDPQPDFVFYGGDLAQLGQVAELELGASILKNLKAPLKIMVGEHDWYFDMGQKWQELFGTPTYSFDHKGVHFVVLNSVVEADFWTARGMTPMERMSDGRRTGQWPAELVHRGGTAASVAAGGSGQVSRRHTGHRLLALAAVQALQGLELLDRRRGGSSGDLEAVQTGRGDSRSHAPVADEPDRQYSLPRIALDCLAMALCAAGHARVDDPDEPSRPVQSERRLRRWRSTCASRRTGRQGLQPLESQSDHGQPDVHEQLGQREYPVQAKPAGLLASNKETNHESSADLSPCLRRVHLRDSAAGRVCSPVAPARRRHRPVPLFARRRKTRASRTRHLWRRPTLRRRQRQDQTPAVAPETSQASTDTDTVTVGSCDGENTVTVAKEATGHALAEALMDQWLRDHPEANWVAEEKAKHTMQPPADNSELLQGEQGKGHTYGNYTERDILTWAREAEKFVAEGSRIFHSGDELGSTVGVSCDMCHPHAANTHPETYPKYQVQLGRVVLLRDMIEWCVENPVRGDHLDPNGATMRALEAYIMAQRKGVAMDYGKH